VRSLSLPNLRGAGRATAIAAGVGLFALVFAAVISQQPLVGLAVPGLLLVGLFCMRWPAFAILLLIALCGTFGSLQAFLDVPAGPIVDAILGGLWLSVLISYALKTRERPWWVWPGMAITLVYIVLTFLEVFTALGVSLGLISFKYSTWYLMAVPLLAFAGWSLRTYVRISRALVAVALLTFGYAAVRLVIGPAGVEATQAYFAAGSYNTIDGELSLIGSFPNRHELAFWSACAVPFCLAMALAQDKGLWRLVAAVAVPLGAVAAFGTDVRAALPAIAAGGAVVVLLNVIAARGRGGPLGQALVAGMLAITGGAVLFTVVVGEDTERYGAILSPSGDTSYEAHITKWEAALEELEGHPFGLGLATAGRLQQEGSTPYVNAASYAIDSTYLKIAFEQGFPVLALFAAAMIALFIGLARRAIRVRAGPVRGLATGAAGTMAAAMAMFVTGVYIETIGVLFLWVALGAAVGAIGAIQEAELKEPQPQPPDDGTAPEPAPGSPPAPPRHPEPVLGRV
jgi:hypothetical protein